MKNWRLCRRDLLKRLGVGAACLPLLRATRARGADAPPLRLLVIQMAEGYRQAYWKPATGSLLGQTLPPSCAPFERAKREMIFLPNLSNPGINAVGFGAFGVMFYGLGSTGTGQYKEPTGPTLDQVVASALPEPTSGRRSLPLGVQLERPPRVSPSPGAWHCFWRGPGEPINSIGDPYLVYNELFGGATTPDPRLKRLMLRRKSILDYVGANLEDFRKRLGTEDREVIAAHQQSIRDVERQLQPGAGPLGSICASPPPAMIDLAAEASYPLILKAHLGLIVAALKCGVTRVATLQTSDAAGMSINFGAFVPGVPERSKNNYKTPYRNWSDLGHNPVQDGVDHKKIVDQWFMDRFAELLAQLAAVPESGGSLLDNMVVVIGNYMQDGANKDVQRAPWMLAGKCGGYFDGGNCLASDGQSIASVMAGICEAMGVPHRYGAVMAGLKKA
jgi:hypothetical protein